MSRKLRLGLSSATLLFAAALGSAAELWVVQFDTPFPDVLPPCQTLVRWRSNLLLHNSTPAALDVTLLDVSNGEFNPNASTLAISPGRTASVRGLEPAGLNWSPLVYSPVWVIKLDVPTGVVISNRVESVIAEMIGSDPNPPCSAETLISAGLPLKVFDRLIPAGVAQYHLGTDIGDHVTGTHLDARINLGIYNDATAAARATIEVRCSSGEEVIDEPDPVLASTVVDIAAHSLTQVNVLASTAAHPCPLSLFGVTPYHVVVTSSQPGFSYVTGISNGSLPRFPAATTLTY